MPRWCHSTAAFSLGPESTEVTMFGGSASPWTGYDEKQPKLADTTLMQFSKSIKGNSAIYKYLNIEFSTKKCFCHENAV